MPTVEHQISFDDEWFGRIKAHIQRHKGVYCFGAGIAVTGVAFGLTAGLRRPMVAPMFYNVNQQNVVNFGGHMSKLVKRLEDGKIWEQVTDAAKDAGAPLSLMSRHLNGHKENVYGMHYEIVGIRTAA